MLRRSGTIRQLASFASLGLLAGVTPHGQGPLAETAASEVRSFPNGIPTDPNFFPIGVWMQQPFNSGKFSAIGVNTFVGLWLPPTSVGLAQLRSHRTYVVPGPSAEALTLKDGSPIVGWLQTDEPDNAQPDGAGGYGDCVPAEELVRRYDKMRADDPTRPVFMNFGQGVANPSWIGRGGKCGAIPPETYYSAASRAADILSFALYPVTETQEHVTGRLDLIGRGVRNLKGWAPSGVPVWAIIETTHVKNPNRRPTPAEIRNQVWIAIINGATGITYFVHEWEPSFREDGVFRYRDVIAELKRLNRQIQGFAAVLNSSTIENAVNVETAGEIAHMVKHHKGATYVFAVNMGQEPVSAKVTILGAPALEAAFVDEHRTVTLVDDTFEDRFEPYEAHIYKLRKK